MQSKQAEFEKFLVSEYFRHGSINKVFYHHHFNLPISYAGFDRVLTKFNVIKSAGPNSKLTESLKILSAVADYKLSLEKAYEKYAPKKLWVSTNTLHRILHYTRLGLTRRQGTALIITDSDGESILMGKDDSLTGSSLGKKGDLSLPMGHSKLGESPKDSIGRVLQQEVFTDMVLEKTFPWNEVPDHPKPIMYMNIADIRVSVYLLTLTKKYSFSSYKLKDHVFRKIDQISEGAFRPGVEDIIGKYLSLGSARGIQSDSIAPEYLSNLNLSLAFEKSKD